MAPEIRIVRNIVDHRPSDVYSFAKTVWMVLSKEKYAFEGQFDPFENHKLHKKFSHTHFVELYRLLTDATHETPSKRPSMFEFAIRLGQWKEIAQNRRKAARSTWDFMGKTVIQHLSPSTVVWKDVVQVVNILQKMTVLNFNHTFLPLGGEWEMIRIEQAAWIKEPNMLALITS